MRGLTCERKVPSQDGSFSETPQRHPQRILTGMDTLLTLYRANRPHLPRRRLPLYGWEPRLWLTATTSPASKRNTAT